VKAWAPKERRALLDAVGAFGWIALQRKCGLGEDKRQRTKGAITQKIRRDFGGGGITRGSYSLEEAMAETGYARTQLRRAAKALGQRWVRTAKGGNFLISAEQLEDMSGWLARDYWSKPLELYACVQCGTETRPHHRSGCCEPCYHRLRRLAASLGLPRATRPLFALVQIARAQGTDPVLDRVEARLRHGKAPDAAELRHVAERIKNAAPDRPHPNAPAPEGGPE
jgi:hypothetical protein